jgi:hypothetical protein
MGQEPDQSTPPGTRGSAELDPKLLESILQATLGEHGTQQLPPALKTLLANSVGREPDAPLVAEMVSAALDGSWFARMGAEQRRALCEAVAQQLLDDPSAMRRIRKLLQGGG